MYGLLLYVVLTLSSSITTDDDRSGYRIIKNEVEFFYKSPDMAPKVFVCGNFMNWKKNDSNWQMEYDKKRKGWVLRKTFDEIKKGVVGSFYEFAFLVNDRLLDAEQNGSNVIHCPGYGYRYVINF